MIIETRLVNFFRAGAITIWPFIFITPELAKVNSVKKHEKIHWRQQRNWAIYGLGVGLILWFFLYLLVLPVKWNYFRRKWETEAYRAQGYSDKMIREVLRLPPYYLS